MKKALHKIASPGEPLLKTIFKLGYFLFTRPGLEFILRKSRRAMLNAGLIKEHQIPYHAWIIDQTESPAVLQDFYPSIKKLEFQPVFAIIIKLKDQCPLHSLKAVFTSVFSLHYDNWELIVCCLPEEKIVLSQILGSLHMGKGKFAVITHDPTNDIPTNVTVPNNCDYVLYLNSEDVLAPNYLTEIVKHLNRYPEADLVYTDNDKLTTDGKYTDPYFKPDWSPDALMATNYIGQTFIISKELFSKITLAENAYDLLLQASEITTNIGHIAKVLFHSFNNNLSVTNAKQVLGKALLRRQTPGTVTALSDVVGIYNINYTITRPGKVSIIIPTKDNVELLKTTLDSIISLTQYEDYEIILLNNNSSSKAFFDLVAEYEAKYKSIFRCIAANFPFNFSKLMNLGVAESKGDYVLLLNNDVEVLLGDWLERMMGYAQHQYTGAVGVKLLFPDNTIQHAGVVLGVGEASAHPFINLPKDSDVHFNAIQTTQNFSAVTAACLMVRKEVYDKVGGMDEELPVEFNDIDFCLKLRQHGYYNVYLPNVELYHYESATRGHPFKSIDSWKQHQRDLNRFRNKWGNMVDHDPFYNPNLTTEYTDYRQKKRIKI